MLLPEIGDCLLPAAAAAATLPPDVTLEFAVISDLDLYNVGFL